MILLAEGNPLNSSALIFPILECLHIAGFGLTVGTIALVDFRLLGRGVTGGTVQELAKEMAPWTLFGLVIMLLTGPAMFSSDPDMYYLNWAFIFKMIFLLAAITFNYTVHKKVSSAGGPAEKTKWVAYVSMLLWCAVVFGGIFIGFLNSTLDFGKI